MKKRVLALLVCVAMLLIGIPKAGATFTILGDADCDGKVTAADASLVLRTLVSLSQMSEQGRENADVNQNGTIDGSDAAMILRHVLKMIDLSQSTPKPSTSASTTPKPSASAGATPTPTPAASASPSASATQPDASLLANVKKGIVSRYSDYAESITLFIQNLPDSNPYKEILYEGAKYVKTTYSAMDCSKFVRETYRDCGYGSSTYPSGGSDNVISEMKKQHPTLIHAVTRKSGEIDTSAWKPGYVLGYERENNNGHVSIYIGKIDGIDFVMESVSSENGVCITRLWEYGDYQLNYYMNPLG